MNAYALSEAQGYLAEAKRLTGFDIPVTMEFNNRLVARFGDASKSGHIRLSPKIWAVASAADRRQVVIHEYCHIVDWMQYRHWGHGWSWQSLMRRCGLRPDRCHQIVCPELQERRAANSGGEVTCGCRVITLSKIRYTKLVKGTAQYCCTKCNRPVKPLTASQNMIQ